MLAFAIFAVVFVLVLLAAVVYLYPSSKSPSTIPGLDPVSKEDGNLGDIAKAGSLHEFLMKLHKDYGPVASFWWGPTYTVSICTEDVFKQHTNVFDKPNELFMMFEPVFSLKSIQFANGEDGRARRKHYDTVFTHEAMKRYFLDFQEVADGLVKKWTGLVKEDHIPVSEYMSVFALKAVLLALYGKAMKDDKKVLEFKHIYDNVWSELELRLTEPPTAVRQKKLQEGRDQLRIVIDSILKERKKSPPQHGEELLIDLLLDKEDPDVTFYDSLVYVIGGFHTTGNLLSWCMYFLATHADVQEKVYGEIKTVLGTDDVDHTTINDLVYLRQVLDETLRCAVIAPWAARFQDFDSEIGGHKIPKNTPVIHAIGVASKNEAVFPDPDKFDPDRFDPKSKHLHHLSFVPFGFAGKRKCPGYKFSYVEATVLLVSVLRKFRVMIVDGQVVEPVHGFVTHPSDEIWITISKR
ncbi:cytochrome P450 20A1-like [Dreissena polymorpha]|uniref:cytochrome P450 20A1-like n=1 Tax=Dreissena polymorpha TaxID=45954 RepID=UPI0022652FB3|nr:cytochrome P450 20A1-like [Dreissena polymorpha]